jgi:hypothetical protein
MGDNRRFSVSCILWSAILVIGGLIFGTGFTVCCLGWLIIGHQDPGGDGTAVVPGSIVMGFGMLLILIADTDWKGPTTDRKKPGVAFWATIVAVMASAAYMAVVIYEIAKPMPSFTVTLPQ